MMYKILVVSDFARLFSQFDNVLFDVEESVTSAMNKLKKVEYRAVVYDAIYAPKDCLGFVECVREQGLIIPLIIVSNRPEIRDEVKAQGATMVFITNQMNYDFMHDLGAFFNQYMSLLHRIAVTATPPPQKCTLPQPSSETGNDNALKRLSDILLQIGIAPNIKGYRYIRDAVLFSRDTPQLLNHITNKLYPVIAKEHSTTSERVERAIRHAVEVAWQKGKIENLNNIYGVRMFNKYEKPSNGEIIALLCDKILMERL